MKFTKEEISLCKQVAKKHKRTLVEGDWYSFDKRLFLLLRSLRGYEYLENGVVPLWSISDCLKFLWKRKRKDHISLVKGLSATGKGEWTLRTEGEGGYWADTPLEACLKAVLAVLEEYDE